MNETTETNKSGLLLGVAIGGAIGAVATLLLAPKSGAELRKDISKTYNQLNEKRSRLFSAVGEKAHEVASSIGNQASGIIDKAKEGKEDIQTKYNREHDSESV